MNDVQKFILNKAIQKVASKGIKKEANILDDVKNAFNSLSDSEKKQLALHTGIGAGVGGIGSLISSRKRKENISQTIKRALKGTLIGGATGAGVSGGLIAVDRLLADKNNNQTMVSPELAYAGTYTDPAEQASIAYKQKEIIDHLTAQLEEKVKLLNQRLVESSHREYPEFNKGLEIIELEKAVENFKKLIEEVKNNPNKASDYYAK